MRTIFLILFVTINIYSIADAKSDLINISKQNYFYCYFNDETEQFLKKNELFKINTCIINNSDFVINNDSLSFFSLFFGPVEYTLENINVKYKNEKYIISGFCGLIAYDKNKKNNSILEISFNKEFGEFIIKGKNPFKESDYKIKFYISINDKLEEKIDYEKNKWFFSNYGKKNKELNFIDERKLIYKNIKFNYKIYNVINNFKDYSSNNKYFVIELKNIIEKNKYTILEIKISNQIIKILENNTEIDSSPPGIYFAIKDNL
jgi:hypothetical protein